MRPAETPDATTCGKCMLCEDIADVYQYGFCEPWMAAAVPGGCSD